MRKCAYFFCHKKNFFPLESCLETFLELHKLVIALPLFFVLFLFFVFLVSQKTKSLVFSLFFFTGKKMCVIE